jgi:hypothetical protein
LLQQLKKKKINHDEVVKTSASDGLSTGCNLDFFLQARCLFLAAQISLQNKKLSEEDNI